MKYAVIVLVACYLLVWGCGPDTSKKAEEQKSQVTHSKVEKTPAPVPAEKAPTPAPAPAPAPAPEKPAVAAIEKAAEKPAPAPVAAPPQPQDKTAEVEKAPMPCDMAAQHPPQAAPGAEDKQLVTLPCGKVMPKEQVPADAPCLQPNKVVPCPMMQGRQHPPMDEMAIMPCGRPFFHHPALPMGHPDIDGPSDGRQPEPLTDIDEEPSQDLAGAMQRMVEATNDMVVVTRQLVVATQEMVRATQEAAYQAQQPQSAPPAAPPAMEKPEPTKGDATATMREAVLATQKALEALNQVLPKVLEPRQ